MATAEARTGSAAEERPVTVASAAIKREASQLEFVSNSRSEHHLQLQYMLPYAMTLEACMALPQAWLAQSRIPKPKSWLPQ